MIGPNITQVQELLRGEHLSNYLFLLLKNFLNNFSSKNKPKRCLTVTARVLCIRSAFHVIVSENSQRPLGAWSVCTHTLALFIRVIRSGWRFRSLMYKPEVTLTKPSVVFHHNCREKIHRNVKWIRMNLGVRLWEAAGHDYGLWWWRRMLITM